VNLHFTLSDHSYTIYEQLAAFDEEGAGVVVKTPTSKYTRLRCANTSPLSNLNELYNLGLRKLPLESLVSLDSFGSWPAESPNADLLQGVRTHEFALVTWALDHGADVNFHGPDDVGVLGALVYERGQAIAQKRMAEFDEETDRLLALLLALGASPTISTRNGNTVITVLSNSAPSRTVRTLLDAGWPNDFQYRLFTGALLGDPALVKEALDNGADPNKPFQSSRYIISAISRASTLAYKGKEVEQEQALVALEQLLKAGAKLDEGTPREGGGDIVRAYAYNGRAENIKPVLELLVRYATPAARSNSLYWLRLVQRIGSSHTVGQQNLDWLIKRLEQ
jgi:hypothetical protein